MTVSQDQIGRLHMTFKINEKDRISALLYLDRKLKNNTDYLMHLSDLKKEREAIKELHGCDNAELLDRWCKAYLSEKQFSALRALLRKKSSRALKPTVNLEINKQEYYNLNDLAAHTNMNVKDYLIALVKSKHAEINPPAAKLSKQR